MGKRFDPRDHYFRRARKEGLRARSAYKLEEVARRHRLLRRGARVLDLGAAPGGFLQVIARAVGEGGLVVGVDLQVIAPLGLPQVHTIVADIEAEGVGGTILDRAGGRAFDLVCSDMAPKTTGSIATDAARSHRLVDRVLDLAPRLLRAKGALVAKVFMGPGFEDLRARFDAHFERGSIERPKAVRSRSKECYLVGLGYRP